MGKGLGEGEGRRGREAGELRQQRSLINGSEMPLPNLNSTIIFYGRFGVKPPNLKTAKLHYVYVMMYVYVAVTCRNLRLFRCVFWSHCCV